MGIRSLMGVVVVGMVLVRRAAVGVVVVVVLGVVIMAVGLMRMVVVDVVFVRMAVVGMIVVRVVLMAVARLRVVPVRRVSGFAVGMDHCRVWKKGDGLSGRVHPARRPLQPGRQFRTDPEHQVGIGQRAGLAGAKLEGMGVAALIEKQLGLAEVAHHLQGERMHHVDVSHHAGHIRDRWAGQGGRREHRYEAHVESSILCLREVGIKSLHDNIVNRRVMGKDQIPPAFEVHDHAHCTGGALARADAIAAERGLRLTPVRRRALEILLEGHRAVGAYEVLDRLAADGFGNQPPVAYRALDFLVEHGLAHRIRRLNAFTACTLPGEAHQPSFFICTGCGLVAEAPGRAVRTAMDEAAAALGFVIERTSIEAVGTCPACREAGA
jgi:Fur family transcriptional regulator, zinc uptake regulator